MRKDKKMYAIIYCWDGHGDIEEYYDISRAEAAEEYVKAGEYGEENETQYHDVATHVPNVDGGNINSGEDVEWIWDTIRIDPIQPPCHDAQDHEWVKYFALGHGGGDGTPAGVTSVLRCSRCGCWYTTDTVSRNNGEAVSVERYEEGED